MQALTPMRIFETLRAYQETAALKAAIDLSIFTSIANGATTVAEIADKCCAAERGVRILCDSLTASSFLVKKDGRYQNTPEADVFLNRHSPAYMGGIAEFLYLPEVLENTMRRLPECVQKGGTMMEGEGSVSPAWTTYDVELRFAKAMAPITVLSARAAMAEELPAEGPLRVLDIAAGHGNFGITVAIRNRQAEITALDWPAVLEVAKENAAKAGVSGRFHTIEGDFFTAELGTGYDAVLITNFFHHFDKPTCEGIMRKVLAALRPGGVAITLEFVPDDDRVKPPSQAHFALTMLVTTAHGDAYTWSEYEEMLGNAGFTANRVRRIETEQSVIISTK